MLRRRSWNFEEFREGLRGSLRSFSVAETWNETHARKSNSFSGSGSEVTKILTVAQQSRRKDLKPSGLFYCDRLETSQPRRFQHRPILPTPTGASTLA